MKPQRASSLVEQLRRRIVDGELVPGQKLPSENQLVTEHGVSRTVVREAITRLQAEGMVHTRRGSGSYVLTPPTTEVSAGAPPAPGPARTLEERLGVLEYRMAIECEAATLSAARRTEGQLQRLEDAGRRLGASVDSPAEAIRHDFDFHRCLAEASANRWLLHCIDALGPGMITMPRNRLAADTAGHRDHERVLAVVAEHEAIRAAVAEQDATGAAAAMRTHLRSSARRLREEAEPTGRQGVVNGSRP